MALMTRPLPATGGFVPRRVGPAAVPMLSIDGCVPLPRRLSLPEVQALGRQQMGPVEITCFSGRPVSQLRSCAGARLVDVLDAAGFSTLPRPERKRCVILAEAMDGYLAIFSWNELYNNAAGNEVLVLYERDGQVLDASASFDLIAAGDQRLGPRHLRGLCELTVHRH